MSRRFVFWCLLVTFAVALPGAIRCGVHQYRFQQVPVRTTGHIINIHLDHGFFRYEFNVADQRWHGDAHDSPRAAVPVDLYSPVEVFYCSDDPAINALQPPPPGARYVIGKMIVYLVVPIFFVGFALGMINQYLRRSIPEEHWPA